MRVIVLIFLLFTLSFGESRSIETQYKVTFGFIGQVGEAQGTLVVNARNRYRIAVTAKATGIAGSLSHGRIDTLESVGTVAEGVFVPETYTNTRHKVSKGEKDVLVYRFDHAAKRVAKEKHRYRDGKLHSQKEEAAPFYASNDILSLFFNHMEEIKGAVPGDHFRFRAIGSGHRDGYIDMEFPKGKKLKKLKGLFDSDDGGIYLIFTIHQKIFASKSGELYLHLSKEGIATEAVLKDVALFGDFTGHLEKIRR